MFRPQPRTSVGVRFALPIFSIVALVAVFLAGAGPALAFRHGLDPSFVASVGLRTSRSEPDWSLWDMVIQPDGKILVAGTTRSPLRLNADGSTDTTFVLSSPDEKLVTDIDLLPDGRMYIVKVDQTQDASSAWVERLNANGSRDTSFTPSPSRTLQFWRGATIETLPDGRFYMQRDLLAAGVGDVPDEAWVRVLADGSIDPSFKVNGKFVGGVRAVDAQGRLYFTDLVASDGTVEPLGLARLLPNDTIDPDFNAPVEIAEYAYLRVFPQANGGLLVDGLVYGYDIYVYNLTRLRSDGSHDPNFHSVQDYSNDGGLYVVAPLADGRIIVGPYARYLANGLPDERFDPYQFTNYDSVSMIVEQPDGKLLYGGNFKDVGIPPRAGVVRLLGDNSPQPTAPPACITRRYTGGSAPWPAERYTDTFFEAGTTFTLVGRSSSAVNVTIQPRYSSPVTLSSVGGSYTAPTSKGYTISFQSATADTSSSWVDVRICEPPRIPPPTCTVSRFTGDGSGVWGRYSRATYPAGTTFTLAARSHQDARGMVFIDSSAVTYLKTVGSSYVANKQAAYSVGFTSQTVNTTANWVDVRICTPYTTPAPPTPSPNCVLRHFNGDGTGVWGEYSRASYPVGTTFTLLARSHQDARGMVFIDSSAVTYLKTVGSSYVANKQAAYSVGFTSQTVNIAPHWVDIQICPPTASAALAMDDEVMLSDEFPEPAAPEPRIFLPLLQQR